MIVIVSVLIYLAILGLALAIATECLPVLRWVFGELITCPGCYTRYRRRLPHHCLWP